MTNQTKHIDGAAIYTDGSARPNPGFYGSGLHGYFYNYPEGDEKTSKVGSLIITDQGYVLQKDFEQSGAQAVIVVSYIDCFAASEYEGTNNVAELNALSMFFEQFPEEASQIKKLHVLADSQYVLNSMDKWVEGWIRNNWITGSGKPVSNQEELKRLYSHLTNFKKNAELVLAWVHGHNDDFGNVKADYLAGIATSHSTSGKATKYKKITDPVGYHKADVDLHPLLGLKRIYFNTSADFNTPGVYYQTGWSGNEFIVGKRTPEASFSVLELKTPDPAIDAVMEAQYHFPSDFNKIVYAKLDRVKSLDVYPYLIEHGRYCLWDDPRNSCVNFMDRKPVTIEVRAGELPMRAIETLNHLEELLGKFKAEYLVNGKFDENPYDYQLHDISNHFYDEGVKKVGKVEVATMSLKKSFNVGIKSTEIKVKQVIEGEERDIKLPLVFMDDIPGRNTLKKLETMDVKIFLITWKESKSLLRYSTIIQTSDAIGIWSNYFANQLLL